MGFQKLLTNGILAIKAAVDTLGVRTAALGAVPQQPSARSPSGLQGIAEPHGSLAVEYM